MLPCRLACPLSLKTANMGNPGQYPPTTLLLPRRTAHPLSPLPHFASSQGLALANPVHSRPGAIESPSISRLTAPSAPDPSTRLPNRPTESHRPGPRLSSPACCPADPAPAPLPRTAIDATTDNQRPPPAPFIGIERGPSRPTALTPCSNPKAPLHRWIRAYWIGRRLNGLAGPEYHAIISFGLPIEPEDSQYGKSWVNTVSEPVQQVANGQNP